MTILGAGAEMSSFFPSDGGVTESTLTGTFNTTNARCSIKLGAAGNTTGTISTPALGSQTTLWFRVCRYQLIVQYYADDYTFLSFRNSSGVEVGKLTVARVVYSGSDMYCKFWHLVSGVMTQIGTTFTFSISEINDITVKVVCGATPSFEIYFENSLRDSGSGSGSSLTSIDKVYVTNTWVSTYVSGIIWGTTSLIGHELLSDAPTGDSATNTAWVGDYTAVDEVVYSDADSISSASNNEVETFTATRSLSGLSVAAVIVPARAKRSASGPQNLRLAIRSGGTNYFSSADKTLTDGYAPYMTVWETDPATSAAWVTVPEFGVKSLA